MVGEGVRRKSVNPLVNHFGRHRSEGVVIEVGRVKAFWAPGKKGLHH